MSADMKAAMETAKRWQGDGDEAANLAAAFLELQAELERERKAREKAEFHRQRHCDTHKQFGPMATCGYCDQLAIADLEQRAADLQARLDRVETETIEECLVACLSAEQGYEADAIRALSAQPRLDSPQDKILRLEGMEIAALYLVDNGWLYPASKIRAEIERRKK